MTIQTLIDKQDNYEIIRDQIAAILAAEVVNQMALATIAAKDPNDWKLRIFTEHTNPWELFLNDAVDTSPLVNVWFDNASFEDKASNVSERQKTEGVFNIDCYGYGVSQDVVAGGHTTGDQEAALEAQRAIRLVRNILMASENCYLQLQGLVWKRVLQNIRIYQPEQAGQTVQKMVAGRISFGVTFNEFSPQYTGEVLEYLAIDINRAEDGQLVAEVDFDYTI